MGAAVAALGCKPSQPARLGIFLSVFLSSCWLADWEAGVVTHTTHLLKAIILFIPSDMHLYT